MRKKRWPKTEVDLGIPVVDYFKDLGWDIYQEVLYGHTRADIVCVRKPLIAVVELKKVLGLEVIAQAHHWLRYANFVYVVVVKPKRSSSTGRDFAKKILKDYGIGLIEVSVADARKKDLSFKIRETIHPELHRKVYSGKLKSSLNINQKAIAKAGSQGGYWTPFKETVSQLERCVIANPGITLKDAINSIKTHYVSSSSARASLIQSIELNIIKTITMKRIGKKIQLYYQNN